MVDKKTKLKKLLAFKQDASFATFNEILQANDGIEEVKSKQEELLVEVKNGNTRLDKQDEAIGVLTEIAQKEPPAPVEFPTEIAISNQISTAALEEKIDGVINAINNKENEEVNLNPLVELLTDIKKKKYPEFSTKELADSIEALSMEIKADRLVDKTQSENPQLEKKFEELIKKIEALIKAGGLGGKKSIIGGWGSDTVTIKNVAGTPLNPATSEKQDSIISHSANVVSTVNSTSTPLGISGVFTGTAEDILKYDAVSVTAFSDKASATNGLSIQFSTDGTNWDNVNAHTTSANVVHVTTDARQARYFRIVYTNGTTAQTVFRLQVIYSTSSIGPVIEEMGGDVSDTTSAITTKAVLFAKNPAGVYGSINRTTGGNLKMSLEEIDPGVALPTAQASYDTLIEDASATITYIGKAVAGTAVGTASWQIKRIDTSSGTAIRFADGVSTFTKVWTSRAAYTYI